MARTITLHIDGEEISAQVFHQKVGTFLDMLRKVDRNVTEDLETAEPTTASVKWIIESIRSGSPVHLTLRADPLTEHVNLTVGERVIGSVTTGLATIQSPVVLLEPPRYFTFPVLEDVHALVRPGLDGVRSITVSTPEQTIQLSEQSNVNLRRFLTPVHEHHGSLEGILQMVSVASGRPRFSVRDRLSGRAIRCTVPRERLPEIIRVFNRRVTVFGRVRTNERGDVLSIHMEGVEAFPAEEDLPSIEQVTGSFDLTRGKSIEEHLENLRDAS